MYDNLDDDNYDDPFAYTPEEEFWLAHYTALSLEVGKAPAENGWRLNAQAAAAIVTARDTTTGAEYFLSDHFPDRGTILLEHIIDGYKSPVQRAAVEVFNVGQPADDPRQYDILFLRAAHANALGQPADHFWAIDPTGWAIDLTQSAMNLKERNGEKSLNAHLIGRHRWKAKVDLSKPFEHAFLINPSRTPAIEVGMPWSLTPLAKSTALQRTNKGLTTEKAISVGVVTEVIAPHRQSERRDLLLLAFADMEDAVRTPYHYSGANSGRDDDLWKEAEGAYTMVLAELEDLGLRAPAIPTLDPDKGRFWTGVAPKRARSTTGWGADAGSLIVDGFDPSVIEDIRDIADFERFLQRPNHFGL